MKLHGIMPIALVLLLAICNVSMVQAQKDLNPEEPRAIDKEAYIYGFPMVMNYKTMYQYAVDSQNPDYKGPFNEVSNEARLFVPDDKAVVTQNSDTPYCMFQIDLRFEPMVLSIPYIESEGTTVSSSSIWKQPNGKCAG